MGRDYVKEAKKLATPQNIGIAAAGTGIVATVGYLLFRKKKKKAINRVIGF